MNDNYFDTIDQLVNSARSDFQNASLKECLEKYEKVIDYIKLCLTKVDSKERSLLESLQSAYVFEMNFVSEVSIKSYENQQNQLDSPLSIPEDSIVPKLKGYGNVLYNNPNPLHGQRTLSRKISENCSEILKVSETKIKNFLGFSKNNCIQKRIDGIKENNDEEENNNEILDTAVDDSMTFINSVKRKVLYKSKISPHFINSTNYDKLSTGATTDNVNNIQSVSVNNQGNELYNPFISMENASKRILSEENCMTSIVQEEEKNSIPVEINVVPIDINSNTIKNTNEEIKDNNDNSHNLISVYKISSVIDSNKDNNDTSIYMNNIDNNNSSNSLSNEIEEDINKDRVTQTYISNNKKEEENNDYNNKIDDNKTINEKKDKEKQINKKVEIIQSEEEEEEEEEEEDGIGITI
ncbi:hypothetical protein WA158_006006 [Blastocystis sp. Blastoise]